MTHEKPQVQVCLRPFTPQEVQQRQQEVLDRIEAVAADGAVVATVDWWSPRVSPPDCDGPLRGGCPPVVTELLALADREGFSLEPFIGKRAGTRPGQDDSLVLPVICLLVRVDGEIGGLYPVRVDDRLYTVEDGLAALEAGEDGLNLRLARA
jgi:hypothetical protein